MKSIIFFILGVILGIIAVNFAISAIVCLLGLSLMGAIGATFFAILFGFIALKCFNKM